MNKQLYLILLILIWWCSFLFYPLWYIPQFDEIRLWAALCLMLAGIVLGYAFKYLTSETDKTEPKSNSDCYFWLILFSGVFALHLPFLNLPVITGLDMIDHASVPALVASKIIHPLSAIVGFPIPYAFTALVGIIAFVLFISINVRNRLLQSMQCAVETCYQNIGIIFAILVFISSLYVWLIYTYKLPDTFGDLETLFRYQPISKLMLIPAYILFGIHEWVGRVIQLLFFFGGAFFLYHTTLMFASKESARFTAMLYLLLPPMFHYGNTHLIEGGSLFFVIAAFFYWIRYFEKRSQNDLMVGSFWATMGCLYKHTNIILIPAFAVLFVWDFFRRRTKKPIEQYGMEIIANSIPAFTFFIYLELSSFSSDTPSNLVLPNWSRLSANILAIPEGVTHPIFVFMIAGFIYVIFIKRHFLPYMISWVIPHFLLTVMSEAYMNVRQALPYYLGLIIAGCLFIDRILPPSMAKKVLFYGIAPVFLTWACLFMPRVHTPDEWGRAMGDRSYINLTNWDETYVPYHIIIPDLMQRTQPGETIFAPMGNDSSQFYLAKYNWNDRVYIRNLFTDDGTVVVESLETLEQQCRQNEYDWLLLPRGKWLLQYIDPNSIEPLFVAPPAWLQHENTYHYGKVEVGLWKIQKEI